MFSINKTITKAIKAYFCLNIYDKLSKLYCLKYFSLLIHNKIIN